MRFSVFLIYTAVLELSMLSEEGKMHKATIIVINSKQQNIINDDKYPKTFTKSCPRIGPPKKPRPLAALKYASPTSLFAPN